MRDPLAPNAAGMALIAGLLLQVHPAGSQDLLLSPIPMVPPAMRQQPLPGPPQIQQPPAAMGAPVPRPPPPQAAAAPIAPLPGQASPQNLPTRVQHPPLPQLPVGALAIAEDLGDWRLQCTVAPAPRCEFFQQRVGNDGGFLLWFEIERLSGPDKLARVSLRTPLSTRIVSTLPLDMDGRRFADLPIITCLPAGCVYAADMPMSRVQSMENAGGMATAIYDLRGQGFAISIGTSGLRAGFLKMASFLGA